MGLINEKELKEISKILDISRMYYIENKSQKKVADFMKMSQSEVSRMLKLAIEENIIDVKIRLNIDLALSQQVKNSFPHLKEVYISYSTSDDPKDDHKILQSLGYEGAKYFINNVEHADSIGVSCGKTLRLITSSLGRASEDLDHSLPVKCKIYSLVFSFLEELVGVTSSSIVSSAIESLPKSIGYAYHIPPPKKIEVGEFKKYIENNTVIKSIISQMKNLDVYFIGIGYVDQSGSYEESYVGLQFNKLIYDLNLIRPLKNLGAIGEANIQPYDKNGKFLIDYDEMHQLKERLLFLPLDVLKDHVRKGHKKVIAVAGGILKRQAIYAALKAKIFNVLITDSLTARKLIELKEEENNK